MAFLKFIWLYTNIVTIAIVLTPNILLCEILQFFTPKTARILTNTLLRYAIKVFLVFTASKVIVEGRENLPADGKYVLMSNHQSQADILSMYGVLNINMAMVGKKELLSVPAIGRWMQHMGCPMLDRKNPKTVLPLFEKTAKLINTGYPILIFPEGTRSYGPKNGPFLQGSTRLAYMAKVPIVPITMNGMWKTLHSIPWGVKNTTTRIVIGKPIDISEYPKSTMSKELIALVQKRVEEGFREENNETEDIKAYAAKYK